jgi:mannosyltransferase OCH1-like enzyme
VLDQLLPKCQGWKYYYFSDEDILNFFVKNPIEEFPNVRERFLSLSRGAHKADLFRYYFIYLYGGVFLDQDAMLEVDLDSICKDYEFFAVNSGYVKPSIFQGLIGATPKNEIVYRALQDIYFIPNSLMDKDYHIICKNLYTIAMSEKFSFSWHLYKEDIWNSYTAKMMDGDKLICLHYYKYKQIPYLINNQIQQRIPPGFWKLKLVR